MDGAEGSRYDQTDRYGSMNGREPHLLVNERLDSQPYQRLLNREARNAVTAISPLRRTFCLVVLFDLILTVILWIFYTEVRAVDSVMDEFRKQVVGYDFTKSLFDTVLLSIFRFVVLILAYALLRSAKPWFVAITTLVTSAVILFKVIYYGYKQDKSNTGLEILDYVVMVSPVVLAWVETWLLDLKVLPHEKKEYERMLQAVRTVPSESSPLLSRFIHSSGHTGTESFYSPAASESEEAAVLLLVGGFLSISNPQSSVEHNASPQASSETHSSDIAIPESDNDVTIPRPVATNRERSPGASASSSQAAVYRKDVADALKKALSFMASDDWRKESGQDEVAGIIYSQKMNGYGKIYKLVAEVEGSASSVYEDMVHNASQLPKWNPTVLEVRQLQPIDDSTEISYNIAAEGAGGMVSSRDFVIIRHWEKRDDCYLTVSISTAHDLMPAQAKYVRGEQGPTVIRMTPLESGRFKLEWLLNTNLKGWLPQYIIDQAMSGVLLKYLGYLKKHAASLMEHKS